MRCYQIIIRGNGRSRMAGFAQIQTAAAGSEGSSPTASGTKLCKEPRRVLAHFHDVWHSGTPTMRCRYNWPDTKNLRRKTSVPNQGKTGTDLAHTLDWIADVAWARKTCLLRWLRPFSWSRSQRHCCAGSSRLLEPLPRCFCNPGRPTHPARRIPAGL